MAGRLDDRERLAAFSIVPEGGQGADLRASRVDVSPAVAATDGERTTDRGLRIVGPHWRKSKRAQSDQDDETWLRDEVANTLNAFDSGDVRTAELVQVAAPLPGDRRILSDGHADNVRIAERPPSEEDDPRLPLGLDSHRYRCCGNGVVADVTAWIGERLLAVLEEAS